MVLRQGTRRPRIKIDIINERDIIVDSFEGITTDGNINLEAEGTYKRAGHLTMVFDKKYNILPSPSSKIWFNKRIGIQIGVESYSGDVVWFNMGRFAVNEVELNFDAAEKTLSCQISDYMSFLDGTLGGHLSHEVRLLANEANISDAIRTSLTGLGMISVEDIKINGSTAKVPYTIEKSPNNTVYELVKELVDIYKKYDFYCDEKGYYVVEEIRDKKNDPVIEVFDSSDKDFRITSTPNMDFKNIKNSIWVWGLQKEDGAQIKWNYRNRWARQSYSDLDNLIDKQKGDICYIENEDKSYVWDSLQWKVLGFNVVPKYNIENIGEKKWSYSNDQIFNEEQAQLRCEYELEQKSNMAETISFSCVPIYYLLPNKKIYINTEDIIEGEYLIKTVSIPLDFGSPMNVTATKLYY